MRFKSSKNSCAPESFERAEVITHTVSAQTRKACPAKTGYTSLTYTNGYLLLSNSGTQAYARIPINGNGTLGAIEPLAFYPAPIQAIASSGTQVYLAGNGGEVAMVNGGSVQRMISRSTENWLTLAAYDGPETHNLLVAGANGAFARLKGINVEEITRIPINSNTEEDILKIVYDTGANAEVLSDDHYTLLGRNGMGKYQHYAYTNGTPLSIAGATTSANIYCGLVDQYSGNTNVIAAGERGVHQRAAATNRSNNFEVYPLPLHKVAFSATNHGIVVGDWGTVRTTTNGGEMWQTISPTFASINAVDHVYAAAVSPEGQFKVAGDNGFVGSVVNNAVVADAEALPNSAIFKDMAYHDAVAETWVAVGADGAAGYVASLHDSETGWIGQAAAGAGFNALTTLPLNDHFIAVGNNAQAKLFKDWSNNEYIASNLTTAPVPVSTHFYDVAMIDAIKGYIVGSGGVVLKCAEGSYPDVDEFGVFHYSDIPFTTPLTTDDGLLGQASANMDVRAIGVTGPYTGILAGLYITDDGTENNDANYARLFNNQNGVYSTLFWYDMLGRIVASQNTKQHQAENRGWSYSLYDELGRVYQAGLKHENPSGEDVFADIFGMDINGAYNPNTIDYAQFEAWIGGQGGRGQVTTTTYDVPSEATLPMTYAQTHLRKRVSSVCYEALYDADAATYDHATHYSYDIHGNVYSLLQDNKKLGDYLQPLLDVTPPLMGDNQRFKRVDYTYDLISGNVHQVSYQQGEPDQFIHRYKYDGDNRITEVRTSKDGLLWDLDAKYLYYAHGPLARTELGDNQVQGVDYAYTLQGWLKGTNSSSLTTDRDMGGDSQPGGVNQYFAKDAASFSLHYFNGDYASIGSATEWLSPMTWMNGETPKQAAMNEFRDDLWNGNISSMWTNLANPGTDMAGDNWGMLGMVYRYDQLNRLIDAAGYNPNNFYPDQNRWDTTAPEYTSYNNHFTYDANGNIETQQRSNQTGQMFENLVYRYDAVEADRKANRLYMVDEMDEMYNTLYTTDIEDQGTMVYTDAQAGTHINADNKLRLRSVRRLRLHGHRRA